MINDIISAITMRVGNDIGSVGQIVAMLLVTFVMSSYEFIVYRLVSHKSMYNKSFHISIMIIPFFIATIIMALQSNVVVTLGTVGALAIIRFRTAVKDPVDMMYLLWSIFIGITCGCMLFESCIITSLFVTIVLLLINLVSGRLLKNPYMLVINSKTNNENEITEIVKANSKRYKLKSRNFTSLGVDFMYQVETNNPTLLTDKISENSNVKQFSLIEFDNDDVI